MGVSEMEVEKLMIVMRTEVDLEFTFWSFDLSF